MDVDIDKLRSLVAQGIETPEVDYKSAWILGEKPELVELAKDVAAMESLPAGGYIVVGADDDGRPSDRFTPDNRNDYDEQKVRARLVAVLGEPLDVNVGFHDYDGHNFLLLGIGPHPTGFRIMDRQGGYQGVNGKQVMVWREGDVFVRRGTSSMRWNMHEARDLVERAIAQRKEQWRTDMFDTIRSQSPSYQPGGFVNVTADIPIAAFESTTIELIRRGDFVGVDVLLRRVRSAALAAVGDLGSPEAALVRLEDQLLRLDVLGVLVARYGLDEVFAVVLDTYRRVHSIIDAPETRFAQGGEVILVHLYSVGAALALDGNFKQVASVARLSPLDDEFGYWKYLLRKAEVISARARIGQDPQTGQQAGLIERAKSTAERVFELVSIESSNRTATDALVQFDVYRGIAANRAEDLQSYTNFAFYWAERAEMAFVKVVSNLAIRRALTLIDDKELAAVIKMMDKVARNEAFMYKAWFGFQNPKIIEFLEKA